MGCCDPEYRKQVLEKEKEVNEKGKETVPAFVKIIVVIITLVTISSLIIF